MAKTRLYGLFCAKCGALMGKTTSYTQLDIYYCLKCAGFVEFKEDIK